MAETICVWKEYHPSCWIACGDNIYSSELSPLIQVFRYCPYCGKPLKVESEKC